MLRAALANNGSWIPHNDGQRRDILCYHGSHCNDRTFANLNAGLNAGIPPDPGKVANDDGPQKNLIIEGDRLGVSVSMNKGDDSGPKADSYVIPNMKASGRIDKGIVLDSRPLSDADTTGVRDANTGHDQRVLSACRQGLIPHQVTFSLKLLGVRECKDAKQAITLENSAQ
jgi:hypothetical protein